MITRLLQSYWFTALTGCVLYLAVTAALIRPDQLRGARVLPALPPPATTDEPSWNFRNPDFDEWVREIQQQREALALREQQLQELETRVQSERQELTIATQTVFQLQAEFDRNVIRLKQQELDNVKRQARILAGMSPEGAAGLVYEMSESEAVRILFAMKTDEASTILDVLSKSGTNEARRAALFTERIRRALPPEPANPRSRISP